MDKTMTTMVVALALDSAVRALRHPEEFTMETREAVATVIEDLARQTRGMLTTELMEEAVRDTNKEGA